jgi:adenine-specific DNA-methyltransferase
MPTLDWIGKKAVLNHHREVPYHLLKCDPKLSVGDPGSGNLLVQGDNLLALKALLPYYAGRVKCIYIDPPYNTGNENWVYNDAVNSPEIRKWLGKVVGAEAEDLSRHDKWLCMMYPRLMVLREFLRTDGAIFVSIDDNEVHTLRALMDEVFGARCFLSAIVWKKRSSPDARDTIGNVHDYLLVYLRSPLYPKSAIGKMRLSEERTKAYKNPDNDPRGPWASVDMTGMTGRATKDQYFTITLPSGKTMKPPAGRSWGLAEATFLALRADNRIWFGKKGDRVPRIKKFLSEADGQVVSSFWGMEEVGTNDEAKKECNALMGKADAFDTPKPLRLIRRILEIATDEDSLVLDSFAGSGTTGHAVLDLNKADEGNRRFILVEMEEDICQTVTAKRLRRVIESREAAQTGGGSESRTRPSDRPPSPQPSPARGRGSGLGFRYCRLGPTIFDETGNIRAGVTFGELAAHVYFTETGEPLPKRPSPHPKGEGTKPSPRPSPGGRGGKWSPLLGVHNGKAVYLLFNGILGDRSPGGGNVLTNAVLRALPAPPSPPAPLPKREERMTRIIYGEGSRLGAARLKREGITFKQIPYGIKTQ